MQLTKQVITKSNEITTPFLLVDIEQIKKNYKNIKKNLPEVEVFYSIKANAHPQIIEALVEAGSAFDITSLDELNLLNQYNLPPEKIICLNPIKTPTFLQEMHMRNITIMAFDSMDEIDKIAQFAPGSQVVLRIVVDNEGSDWPLTKKYGVDPSEAMPLLHYAKQKGLEPIGLTFHVGSQCLNKNNWVKALFVCDTLWNLAKKEGIHFNFLSLGGGIPIQHTKPIPTINEIAGEIKKMLQKNFKTQHGNLRVTIEPGRGIVGDAAIMVTSVIGKAKRGNENWLYIDAGVFNAFMETVEGFSYEIKTIFKAKKKLFTIGGPSCDSVDIPFKDILLPDVALGSKIFIMNAGAYTTVYASNFNGFGIPKTYFI